MNLEYFVIFIVYFLFCQYLIEKKKVPKEILEMKVFKLLLVTVLLITLSMVLGIVFRIAWLLVPAISIFSASIIAANFRRLYKQI